MAKKAYLEFIRDQWTQLPPVEEADLDGKTVIVVGANVGIGLEAAKHFARMQPKRLIVACRSEAKGKVAIAEIASETGYSKCELWLIDLADFSSVKDFAARFEKDGGRLDILVMNAGIAQMTYETTKDGWEQTLEVNHLSTALLSLLLTPRLIETGKEHSTATRLVIVASEVHFWAKIPKETQNSPKPLSALNDKEYNRKHIRGRYNESKLLNVAFVRAMNDHLQSMTPLIVTSVNPGFCYSQLRRGIYERFPLNIFMRLMEIVLAWTSEQGARQLVYAALVGGRKNDAGLQEKMRGAYVSHADTEEVSDVLLSQTGAKFQANVWDETIEILGAVSPKVHEITNKYLIA